MKTESIEVFLKHEAQKLCFSGFGICDSGLVGERESQWLTQWIAEGFNGSMNYMANNLEKRLNPDLTTGVKNASVIVLALSYYADSNEKVLEKAKYKVARYSHGRNYHNVMRKKLKAFGKIFEVATGHVLKSYVDTAPVVEKFWARRAGLGEIGKHGCLIMPHLGSWVVLAVCFTDLQLKPSESFEKDLCLGCTRCIDACPTGALMAPRKIDARKCISYLTVEHKNPFDANTSQWKDWIWGCDICQEVCPHNKAVRDGNVPEFVIQPAIIDLMRGKVNIETFESDFEGTSLRRGGKERIARNIEWTEKFKSD